MMANNVGGAGTAWLTVHDHSESLARELFAALDADVSFFIKQCGEYIEAEHKAGGLGRPLSQLRDRRLGRESDTLLHSAAKSGSVAATAFLLQHGCEVNATSSSLTLLTPLHCAIALQHVRLACDLVAAGARCDIVDINGDCVFHYLARTNSVVFLKRLVAQAGLPEGTVQQLASWRNSKRGKLPEDIATSELMRKVLASFRESGSYASPPRRRPRAAKKDKPRVLFR